MEYITHSPAETEELGCRLGRTLRPGAVVAYFGGLGLGKTAFPRGLARGLGGRGRVTSPTFTIVNEYDCLLYTSVRIGWTAPPCSWASAHCPTPWAR